MDCNLLTNIFDNLERQRRYHVTIVSNQRNGVVGYGKVEMTKEVEMSLVGRGQYLRSDRISLIPIGPPESGPPPGGGFQPRYEQPFSTRPEVAETMSLIIRPSGDNRYKVDGDFENRPFSFEGQCIQGAIIGSAPAVGVTEPNETAIYTITVDDSPPPIIH